MKKEQILEEIDGLIELVESKRIQAPPVIYTARTLIKNLIKHDIVVKFQAELFLNRIKFLAHNELENVFGILMPAEIISKNPEKISNINVTISKAKNDIYLCEIKKQEAEIKELKKALDKYSIRYWLSKII